MRRQIQDLLMSSVEIVYHQTDDHEYWWQGLIGGSLQESFGT
jgi:hypothetical protein